MVYKGLIVASSSSCYAVCCGGLYLIVVDSNGSSLCIQPEADKDCTATLRHTHTHVLTDAYAQKQPHTVQPFNTHT